jgi:hypothetical protein
MKVREDLLHLGPEALTQAANAGVVKRAVRELEGGYKPEWTLQDDGTLVASFSDGIRTTWPASTPVQQVRCSCGAASVCRHRIILALAYREAANAGEAPAAASSPGDATDEALARVIAASLLAKAAATRDAGLTIDIRRQAGGEPCDTARLPSATVRYWAGASIEAARCDCIAAAACEHVALGVWAFRQADREDPALPAMRVRLGSEGERLALDTAPWVNAAEALVRHGVTAGAGPISQGLSQAIEAARKAQATWLDHLLQDIEQWSAAYAARSTLYRAEDGVALLGELSLRLRAGVLPGNALAVLGIGQRGETELDRLRLVCLGARTQRDGELRRTRLVLADTDTTTALVLTKEWKVPAADAASESVVRATEKLAPGVRLEALAQGQLLANQARRLADGSLRLARSRGTQNSVLPQVPDWASLGPPLRYESVKQLAGHQLAHPTVQVLPRHAARQFVVFTPEAVEEPVYDPTAQSLVAILRDRDGAALLVRRTHEGHTRHALDALAGAYAGRHGPVRHVAGLLHWDHGLAVIEPWAVACDAIVVPDFAQAGGDLAAVELGHVPDELSDPASIALKGLRSVLADLLHHGLAQLPRGWKTDCEQASQRLAAQELHVLARLLRTFGEDVLAAQANPREAKLAPPLLDLAALVQLHEDAAVTLFMDEATASA